MRRHHLSILFAITIILSFCLRIYQLGRYSFWNDEAGQIIAAIQPSMNEFISVIKTHAMAMPLDYLVTRFFTQFTLSEAVLRFPSTVWSTLTVVVFFIFTLYALDQHPSRNKIAFLSAVLFAVSPIHVYFAQEIRFYAALGLFYWAANLFMLLFLRTLNIRWWFLLVFSLVVGLFFHPFVLLALVNGFIVVIFPWLLHFRKQKGGIRFLFSRVPLSLALAGIIGFVAFCSWVILIQPTSQYDYEIFHYNKSLSTILFQTIGWMGIKFCESQSDFGPWELFLITSMLIGGILLVLKRRSHWSLIVFFVIGVLFQIGLIGLLNYYRGYWWLYRQMIHLTPILFVVSAIGMVELVEYLVQHLSFGTNKTFQTLTWGSVVLLILLVSFPRLIPYYNSGKSNARQIVSQVINYDLTGGNFLVFPGNETKIFSLYFDQVYQKAIVNIKPVAYDTILENEQPGERNFIVFSPDAPGLESFVLDHGYQPVLMPADRCWGLRALYMKPAAVP